MSERSQQEKYAAQRQAELLINALENAKSNGGILLNAGGKAMPQVYPKGAMVSAFNSLTLSLHSDANGYKTNLYTLFSESKKRGEGVQSGEKGVPFLWYSWNEYQNKADSNEKISREEYSKLPIEEQSAYKPIREREVRTLFNVEQTTLPSVNKEVFEKLIKDNGTEAERGFTEKEDKQRRISVNAFLLNIKDNLVPIRKDGTGVARYDSNKDLVFIPAQKHFNSYSDYVQEALRLIISATGHPQRLARQGMQMEGGSTPTVESQQKERLIVELVSAVKMNQFGMPGKLTQESINMIDDWKKLIAEKPNFMESIEADINNTMAMISRADSGEKIPLIPALEPVDSQTDTINAKVVMIRDDNNQWALYIKPEAEEGFSIYPEKSDVNRFFHTAKQGNDMLMERVRQELAQKYYTQAISNPGIKVDLFNTAPEDVDLSKIQKVNIFKTKSDESKILCMPTIEGAEKIQPREISSSQWQRLWVAQDKGEYKRHLAATLFADVLREKQQVKDQSQEVENENVLQLSSILRQMKQLKSKHPDAVLLFRVGDFYQTYAEDAQKASKILGITLTRSNKTMDNKPLEMAGFPYHTLDSYLPRLIRAGERVAICDQLTMPKREAVKESITPVNQQEQRESSHGYHR